MERSTSALWQWSPSATRRQSLDGRGGCSSLSPPRLARPCNSTSFTGLHAADRSDPVGPRVSGGSSGTRPDDSSSSWRQGWTSGGEAHALTHELIHVERGLGFKEAERKDEEATVRRLTRCRMAFYDGRLHESVPAVGR